jgi:hypothetical protein
MPMVDAMAVAVANSKPFPFLFIRKDVNFLLNIMNTPFILIICIHFNMPIF